MSTQLPYMSVVSRSSCLWRSTATRRYIGIFNRQLGIQIFAQIDRFERTSEGLRPICSSIFAHSYPNPYPDRAVRLDPAQEVWVRYNRHAQHVANLTNEGGFAFEEPLGLTFPPDGSIVVLWLNNRGVDILAYPWGPWSPDVPPNSKSDAEVLEILGQHGILCR